MKELIFNQMMFSMEQSLALLYKMGAYKDCMYTFYDTQKCNQERARESKRERETERERERERAFVFVTHVASEPLL